jgi:hypothetical protein
MATPRFVVGQRIWFYDPNRRKYDDDRNLVESYSWVPHWIVKVEGRFYWVSVNVDGTYPRKISWAKADATFKSDYEKDDLLFIAENRQRLVAIVQRAGADTLRRIAEAIGD